MPCVDVILVRVLSFFQIVVTCGASGALDYLAFALADAEGRDSLPVIKRPKREAALNPWTLSNQRQTILPIVPILTDHSAYCGF